MNTIKSFTIGALSMLILGCGTDKPAKSPDLTEAAKPISTASTQSELDACGKRMQSFLSWYLAQTDIEHPGTDLKHFSFKFPVSPGMDSAFVSKLGPDDKSSTKYIQMNWPSVDRYLESLKKSGYFSKSYLAEKKASIQRRGKAYDASHMDDGEAEGFEADEVFWMMELYEPSTITKLKPYHDPALKSSSVAYALPGIYGDDDVGFLLYTKSENGRCVIDSIAHLRNGKPESLGNR
jgi:hypothetical protein